ncbi:MAG: sialidase family protein [Stenotrophobium sp.]
MFALLLLAACGGGGGGASSVSAYVFPSQPASSFPITHVSFASPFSAACNGTTGGTLYVNAEVEPRIAADPTNPLHLIGVWQQDRWSSGGSRGVLAAVSLDGGKTWQASQRQAPFTPCEGGNAANGGTDERASDPWISFAPDGTAYQIVLSLTGELLKPGSSGAMLVSRSTDGGQTWSDPVTLIRDSDGANFFNDKDALTADPTNAHYVYAVWDRLSASGGGPAYFARTTDGGASWEAARAIYDPGPNNQTVGNQIVVLADGTLLNLLTEVDNATSSQATAFFAVMRSGDHGATWSAPIKIADDLSVGVDDPETGKLVRDAGDLAEIALSPSDGSLTVVWEDARFTNGQRNGIAFSRSTDGGLTWSAPAQVNGDSGVSAFIPTVSVLANGTVGVTYYDFRDNTPDPASLPTDVWLASSADGKTWHEEKILGPFDLDAAPYAEGLFVGDYEGLVGVGGIFVPLLVQANHADIANPTDVFALQVNPATMSARSARLALPAAEWEMTPEFAERVQQHQIQLRRWRENGR